jgi:hypothetical protein
MSTGLLEMAAGTAVSITVPRQPQPAVIVLKPETWRVVRADGTVSDPTPLPAAVAEAEQVIAMLVAGKPAADPRLDKLQALADRPGTPGEGIAATAALERITGSAA